MVGTGRLELPTSALSEQRSNQLSYAPISMVILISGILFQHPHLSIGPLPDCKPCSPASLLAVASSVVKATLVSYLQQRCPDFPLPLRSVGSE